MTDKKQPEALRLAELLELAPEDGIEPQAVEDAAAELRRLHAELETLTLYKNMADEYGLSIFPDIAEMTAELETLRAKIKTYEGLGGAAGLIGALEDAQRAINSMKVEAETAAQGDEQMMLEACETISNEGLQADMAIRAALASHGQAPAQDANEYLDLLAQCRSAFPIPERGDPLEVHWAAAMADPGEVPGYLQEIAARHAAQAAPAVVAGPSDDLVTRDSAMRAIEHVAQYNSATREREAVKMLAAAPTAQPAPQQEVQANTKTHDLLGTMIGLFLGAKDKIGYKPGSVVDKVVAEAVEHLKDWPYPEPAPQQEAQHLAQALTDPENQPNQYSVEFGMSGPQMHFKIGNQLFKLAYEPDEQEEFEFMKRMLINAFSIFTPDVKSAPAAQGDALDAARYRWLRERSSTMFVNISINGEGAEIAATLDSAVDAARAAQEGK